MVIDQDKQIFPGVFVKDVLDVQLKEHSTKIKFSKPVQKGINIGTANRNPQGCQQRPMNDHMDQLMDVEEVLSQMAMYEELAMNKTD